MTITRQVIMMMMILTVLITSFYTPPVKAASDDECAIWLCLPTGFPSGCGGAKSAFKKRIKKLKPPLPDFIGCMIKQDEIPPQLEDSYKPSEMSYSDNIAAKMPDGSYLKGRPCIRRGSANGGGVIWSPYGCTGTYKEIAVYVDDVQAGETYYYDVSFMYH